MPALVSNMANVPLEPYFESGTLAALMKTRQSAYVHIDAVYSIPEHDEDKYVGLMEVYSKE